jgi:hypothetical protein
MRCCREKDIDKRLRPIPGREKYSAPAPATSAIPALTASAPDVTHNKKINSKNNRTVLLLVLKYLNGCKCKLEESKVIEKYCCI